MIKKILLNNHPLSFNLYDLPLLIHGKNGSGASHFTINLAADFYKRGYPILFLSGFHMAYEEMLTHMENKNDSLIIENLTDLEKNMEKRVLFLKRENANLFQELLNNLPDISNRVIFVKNIELFTHDIVHTVVRHSTIILSGNIEDSIESNFLFEFPFNTNIYFSPLDNDKLSIPSLEKYTGYLISKTTNGITSLIE